MYKICQLCKNKANIVENHLQGYVENDFYQVYFCNNCNTSFIDPMETGEVYNFIYQNAKKVLGYDRYYHYSETVKNQKKPLDYLADSEESYWVVKDVLSKIKQPKLETTVIEIGSGLGYLTYALNKDGYNALGIDISQEAVERAKQKFGFLYVCADIYEYAEKHQGLYDVVIMSQVIEHIKTPIDFLISASLLLKQKGRIILITPNKTIYSKTVIWHTDSPPIHLWWFSETSMLHISNILGMNAIFVNFTNYYKKKMKFTSINPDNEPLKPIFNSNGKLMKIVEESVFLKLIKTNLKKCNFIVYLVNIIKNFIYAANVVRKRQFLFKCGKTGEQLGVVFYKN